MWGLIIDFTKQGETMQDDGTVIDGKYLIQGCCRRPKIDSLKSRVPIQN